jgi:hypothetical protein
MARTGRPLIDLTGKEFHDWTVLRRADVDAKYGEPLWLCRCRCGRRSLVPGGQLRRGGSRRCRGCADGRRKYGLGDVPAP